MSESRRPSKDTIPVFGVAVDGADYLLRPGGYAVIFDRDGALAVVSTPRGCHLPGGGQELKETLEETTVREVREETGLAVRIVCRIGAADELVHSDQDGRYYRQRCTFFRAEIEENCAGNEPDHQLVWMAVDEAVARFVHGSHRWAVTRAATIGTQGCAGSFFFSFVQCPWLKLRATLAQKEQVHGGTTIGCRQARGQSALV